MKKDKLANLDQSQADPSWSLRVSSGSHGDVACTAPAIEFKHQNISGALLDADVPYIPGYKPLTNYQPKAREPAPTAPRLTTNYVEREARNRSLEVAGERQVMNFESVVRIQDCAASLHTARFN